MTSLLDSLLGWSASLITGALIGSLLSWKASTILNHYNLPTFSLSPIIEQWHQDLAGENKRSMLLTLCTWGSSLVPRLPGFLHQICTRWFLSSAVGFSGSCVCLSSLSEKDFLDCCLHEHLAGVCAICAFSQQVITNCSLTSHSVQLDSPCWHGRGQISEGAGWQQLDGRHIVEYKGRGCWVSATETTARRKYVEKIACFLSRLA